MKAAITKSQIAKTVPNILIPPSAFEAANWWRRASRSARDDGQQSVRFWRAGRGERRSGGDARIPRQRHNAASQMRTAFSSIASHDVIRRPGDRQSEPRLTKNWPYRSHSHFYLSARLPVGRRLTWAACMVSRMCLLRPAIETCGCSRPETERALQFAFNGCWKG